MTYDFWIALAGLIVAISGIILTFVLRLYDYRKQGSQRRIDRIGNALRKLRSNLVYAKSSYDMRQEKSPTEKIVPLFYSWVEQVCKTFDEEIWSKGLDVDMEKVTPMIVNKLADLFVRYKNMHNSYLKKSRDDPENNNAYYDELRRNVFEDTEIERLIKELEPLLEDWLAKHP